MNIIIITELLALAYTSARSNEIPSFGELWKRKFVPPWQEEHDVPVLVSRGLPYLPEEDRYVGNDRPNANDLPGDSTRDDRALTTEYHNLCEIVTRRVEMNDDEYEYQPPHYREVFCKTYSLLEEDKRSAGFARPSKQKCAHPAFHCVQRSRTLFMVRRRWEDECWEPFTREIASGCDCMWPVADLGDITSHY